ncbi:hypothetical protein [Sutcliffiella horikoshii]|uniref:hypothetical protein n=1 Tax=Sutcliffiella horikoshii TaxID=79883 RepID=UPI00384B762A
MNNHNGFANVREGEPISYELFIYFLEQGREIEFSYLDELYLYFIDNAKKGRALWRDKHCYLGIVFAKVK